VTVGCVEQVASGLCLTSGFWVVVSGWLLGLMLQKISGRALEIVSWLSFVYGFGLAW
jgi:hypothetical protein